MERWLNGSAENYIYYYYDESGVCGMNYNGTEYYYRKNILGDVIAIYDSLGNLQCRYVYDAWGNHKVYNASGSEIGAEVLNIGNINSIRYRSYYWDSEFSLYYLQSRYYDPALGRFISPDGISYLNPESVAGFNLYAYCENNPVMNVDPDGTVVVSLLVGLAISFVVGSAASAISQGFQYGWDNISYGQVLVDGLFATASTALAATGIGLIGSIGVGAVFGFGQYAIDSAFHGEEITLGGSLLSVGIGAFSGLVSGAGAKNMKNIAGKLSGRAKQGVKALTTAAQRYGIDSKQVGLVRNLYQGAIDAATQIIVNKSFTEAVFKISSTTIGSAIAFWFYNLLV